METPRWVGLTATPYRSDHMDALITMQLGPIRHSMLTESKAQRYLRIYETSFSTEGRGTDGPLIQAIYNELAADEKRNRLIVEQVAIACDEGRCSLVLTNRLDHLEALAGLIEGGSETTVLRLHGRQSSAERRGVRAELTRLAADHSPFVLVAIDKVAGEGLDLPTLNTLFLAVPISFKGRVVQQIGRITRGVSSGDLTDTGKAPAVVHDFHDSKVPMLDRMHGRRRRVMAKEGFVVESSAS